MSLVYAVFLTLFFCGSYGEVVNPNILKDVEGNIIPDEEAGSDKVNWEKIQRSPSTEKWNAVGQLGSCTATVIKPPNCGDYKKQKVQVLTNGHCMEPSLKMKFNMFDGTTGARPTYDAKPIYSTMQTYDLAVVELNVNYEQLGSPNIKPMEIAESYPKGKDVVSVSIPLQHIPKNEQVLRRSTCGSDEVVTNITSSWLWPDMIGLSKCSVLGGSSGSSLFNENDQIVGLVNSGNVSAEAPKGMHDCKYDTCTYAGTESPKRDTKNYAFDATILHKCFANCKLDINIKGCPLPNNDSYIRVENTSPPLVDSWTDSLTKRKVLTSDFDSYMVKGCSEVQSSCNCENQSGYKSLNNRFLTPADYLPGKKVQAKVGEDPVFHFLCIRGRHADGRLDDLKNVRKYPVYLYKEASIKPPFFLGK